MTAPSASAVSGVLRRGGHPRCYLNSARTPMTPGFQVVKAWQGEVLVLDRRKIEDEWLSSTDKLLHYGQTLLEAGYPTVLIGVTPDFTLGMDKVFRLVVKEKR